MKHELLEWDLLSGRLGSAARLGRHPFTGEPGEARVQNGSDDGTNDWGCHIAEMLFQRMDGVRPASADLAIEKARTAARLQRPTAEIEDNINRVRTAFVTAGIAALRGGVPIRVNGEVVGAVGVAGFSMENDTGIANAAAAALSPLPKTAH